MIQTRQKTVYFAPTAGRHFMTKRAAIRREAAAIIARKYPSEKPEYDEVGCTDRGFHWSAHDRLVRLHARLVRILSRQASESQSK